MYAGLKERLGATDIHDASDLLLALRQIKSPDEIALLRACARITDAGLPLADAIAAEFLA